MKTPSLLKLEIFEEMKIFIDKLNKLKRWYQDITIQKIYFSVDKKINVATSNAPRLDKRLILSRIIELRKNQSM